jgi:hypothetical protein
VGLDDDRGRLHAEHVEVSSNAAGLLLTFMDVQRNALAGHVHGGERATRRSRL